MNLKNITKNYCSKSVSFIIILFLLITVTSNPIYAGSKMNISKEVFNTSSQKFIFHTDNHPYGSYIIQYLPYQPVNDFFNDLEKKLNKPLKNRGEAHITIITPVEYNQVLKPFVSIQEISELAVKMDIQNWKFKILGLGEAQAKLDGVDNQTYFLIVKSKKALEFRNKVFNLYVKNGGHASRFDPFNFYSHITVGFTKRDLYESDGVIKGINSKIMGIEITE